MDIHKLFDEGLITLSDKYEVMVSTILQESNYKRFHGKKINLPKDHNAYPSPQAIKKHREGVFKKVNISKGRWLYDHLLLD